MKQNYAYIKATNYPAGAKFKLYGPLASGAIDISTVIETGQEFHGDELDPGYAENSWGLGSWGGYKAYSGYGSGLWGKLSWGVDEELFPIPTFNHEFGFWAYGFRVERSGLVDTATINTDTIFVNNLPDIPQSVDISFGTKRAILEIDPDPDFALIIDDDSIIISGTTNTSLGAAQDMTLLAVGSGDSTGIDVFARSGSAGLYSLKLPSGWSGTLYCSGVSAIGNQSYSNLTSNTTKNFTVADFPGTYTITGTATINDTGAALNNGGFLFRGKDNAIGQNWYAFSNSAGTFTFSCLASWTGELIPYTPGYFFTDRCKIIEPIVANTTITPAFSAVSFQ